LKSHTFEQLVLKGGEAQDFKLPNLGSFSLVDNLVLDCGGRLQGTNSFTEVTKLSIKQVPQNGLDLASFPKAIQLSFEWEKGLDEQICGLSSLKEFSVTGLKTKGCEYFSRMNKLEGLYVTQGSLASLEGIEQHSKLKKLALLYLRKLESIESVKKLKKLQELYFGNLPKVTGNINIKQFTSLEKFESHSTKLIVDLSDIKNLKNLKMIAVTDECVNLNVQELFSLHNLYAVSLPVSCGEREDEKYLTTLAAENRMKVKSLQYVGPKKNRKIQIIFDPE
jgi:hypothetical protein